jgi:hypothetical protein
MTIAVRPLPVLLPTLPDELLSSWLNRHAHLYGISGSLLLRHCRLDTASPRRLDFALSSYEQRQLAHAFRTDPKAIRRMMQSQCRVPPAGLIATNRMMQVCKGCRSYHRTKSETHGAQLRSWMEGWRMSCPVCGCMLEDSRTMNLFNRADPANPLLIDATEHAAKGELIMAQAIGRERLGKPVINLMRSLLLPRPRIQPACPIADIPRLLEILVPGFDDFLSSIWPGFRCPPTLLLPMSIRIPVLAGVARVMQRPKYWSETLVNAANENEKAALAECLEGLG